MKTLAEFAEDDAEADKLRKALLKTQRKLESAKLRTADLQEAVYRAALEAAAAQGPAKIPPKPKDARRKSAEVALLHLTDWQYGKASETYSMEVCEERILRAVEKTLRITEIQRADHPVSECHVMLGGDMVEGRGNIFPSQVYEIEAYLYDQLFGVARIIESALLGLLAGFQSITVWEESGNHGRLGKRGEDPPTDNADRMAYRIARERISTPRVTWWPQDSWHRIVEIGNYRAMLAHGDEIKSFGGNVPAFGILRKCNAWASGVVEPFQDVYLGHYHQAMTLQLANGGRVFVTPSPESSNVYAQEFVAATGTPGQRLHFVDPDQGRVTSEHLLWLD